MFQSSVLHTEILVNFGINAVNDKLTDLHSDGKGSPFTLVVYVGLILPPTGLWLLRDGPYLPNTCGTSHNGPCHTVFEICRSRSRGAESSAVEREGIDMFCSRLFEIVRLEPTVKDPELLPSGCAPQFYDRPTMYIFPSGQGSSAFFGMADFSLLADTGYGRDPFCWDLVRLRERLDVLLVTHLGIHNLFGMKSMLEKMKMMDELSRPKIGHTFLNCWKQNEGNSMAVAATKDVITDKGVNVLPESHNQTMLNWRKEAMSIVRDLEQLKIDPQPCVSEGIETHKCLYHKVGIGSACLDVLWPNNDEQLKQFLKTWKDDITDGDFVDRLPTWDMFSVCAVLYWLPSPQGKRIRVLLTGGAPESVVFAGLEKLKRKAKLGKPMDSHTCLCKDTYKDFGTDRTGNETMKKPEHPKKGNNGGRIQTKEKPFVAKGSAPKGNGAVGSGSTVTAQRDAKQHAKPPSGVSCGKSREAKSHVGAKGHSNVKMEVGRAKGLDVKVETSALLRAEYDNMDNMDEYAESKRVDALGKVSEVDGAVHPPKHGDQNTIHRNMKQANKLLKAAMRSSAHTKKSSNVRTIEETKKDVGKSIDVCASEKTKDVLKSSDVHAGKETKKGVGKSINVCASERTNDVLKSSDAHAMEETKDVVKSSDVRESEETKAAAKSCRANEEDFSKSSDASESKETNEEIGKSSDVHASDEVKENVGKSGNCIESKEGKEDLALESIPGSVDATSRGSRDEQIVEQARVATGRELERCPEKAKELIESDVELRGTKEEAEVPFVHKEIELPPVNKDAVVSCGAIEAAGPSSEKDMAVPAATKEDQDKPSAKDEVVLPPEVRDVGDVTKEDQDIPAAKDEVVPPSEVSANKDDIYIPPGLPVTTEDQAVPPAEDAVVLSFEVAVTKEDRDVSPSEDDMVPPPSEVSAAKYDVNIPLAEGGVVLPPAVPAAEDRVVPPSKVPAAKEDVDIPPAEGVVPPSKVSSTKEDMDVPPAEDMVVPPSEVPATKEDKDIPPAEGEMPSSNVLATKLGMDVPPAEDGVVPPPEVPTIKEDMDVPPAGERVLPPSELPAMKGDHDELAAEDGMVPPSKVPATKGGEDVLHAEKEVVSPSKRKVTKVPKKKKPLPSADERHKALSEVQTLAEKLRKTPAGADDLDRADSLDDLPSISKTDQLSDSKHCSEATHIFLSSVAAHDPDFDVEILRGGSGNDFPALNPFQGIAYKEDIFTVPRSLADDCDLHFNVERKASSISDVEQDSLDGDCEHFDPGQTWEPMNLPEPEPPKHLSGAKVGNESNEQRKKRNVRNHKKPCPDDVERPPKSKPAKDTRTNNDKSKKIVADSTLSEKVMVQKSTKVEATRSGLSDLPATVSESKVSEPKTFAHRSRPTNDEAVYFTVAFIPCHGEPQYVSKLFFQRVRARYYVLSSVGHELSFLDGLLEAKKEWEEDQEVKFPVSIIPTHGSKVLEEWVASHSEQLSRLNVDVRKAADECKVCCGAADEKDGFRAFQLDL